MGKKKVHEMTAEETMKRIFTVKGKIKDLERKKSA
jgi:hypothetical protein